MRSAEHNVISFINVKRKFICCEPVIILIAVFTEKQICIISKHHGLTFIYTRTEIIYVN